MRAGPPSAPAAPRPIPAREARAFLPGVTLRGARLHNLRNLDVTFPAGALVAVTGVSGSGKSTLVRGVLGASLAADLRGLRPVGCAGLEVHLPLGRVDLLEQIPAAPGSLSTVATAAEVAETLRRRFAATEHARALKLSPRHFSSNVPGGRCEACEGRGHLTVAMDLLPDVTVGCEACQGLGFKPEILECRIGGRSIAQILAVPLAEAFEIFREDAALAVPLGALVEAGLGYLRLGQETKSLSGGEGQRLRLAGILARPAGPGPRAAILLDEPARGLDADHVGRLAANLARLAVEGHLIVAVEHDPELVRAADWVIDLGPGGGPEGGALVVCGPPGTVAACRDSATGQVLAGA